MFSFLNFFSKSQKAPKGLPAIYQEYNNSRYTKNLSAICHAPFVNMYFAQDGQVKLCCHNMEYSIGKYPDQSISDIWNSKAAQKIRQDMKEYKLFDCCTVCKRDLDLRAYDEVSAKHFDSLPQHPSYPTMMEFLLTNTCNLECIMCKGEFSSLIRQNREQLPPIPNVYDNTFVEQLKPFIPYLHEARFSGSGEAFLIDLNYKIWELILELNPNCLIMIQTNGMVMNSKIKDLLDRGKFQIGVSIDSLNKETFEAIRPHARFERVLENIKYFSEYSQKKKIKFSVALCVMRQNWQELPDFVQFANQLNATATFHKVWHPMSYSLKTLSRKKLEDVLFFLKSKQLETTSTLEIKNAKHYQYIIDLIEQWKEDAPQIHNETRTDEELTTHLLNKYRHFLASQFQSSQQVKEEFEIFKDKLNLLLQFFEEDGVKRKLLVHMNIENIGNIYIHFKENSIENLHKLSKLAPDIE